VENTILVTISAPSAGAVWTGKRVISWNAADLGSTTTKIALFYASLADATAGKWTKIADQLANIGQYEWDTATVSAGGIYKVKVEASDDFDRSGQAVSDDFQIAKTPEGLLHGPNPASSNVAFYFGQDVVGTLYVYDAAGRRVWSAPVPPGLSKLDWDLTNTQGKPLANGLYIYLLVRQDGSRTLAQRLVIER